MIYIGPYLKVKGLIEVGLYLNNTCPKCEATNKDCLASYCGRCGTELQVDKKPTREYNPILHVDYYDDELYSNQLSEYAEAGWEILEDKSEQGEYDYYYNSTLKHCKYLDNPQSCHFSLVDDFKEKIVSEILDFKTELYSKKFNKSQESFFDVILREYKIVSADTEVSWGIFVHPNI